MAKSKTKSTIAARIQSGNRVGDKIISPEAVKLNSSGSTDHMMPVFSFCDACPNHFQLSDWRKDELKALMDTFKDMGGKPWSEVRKIKGFKAVDPATFSQKLPKYISPDVTIHECRVTGKARLFGHRTDNIFNVIWFDRNHQVYPM